MRGPPAPALRLALALAVASVTACGLGPIDVVEAPAPGVGLVAHWSFDEGMGTSVLDHSGNGLDGALTGGTWITDGQFGGALYLSLGDCVTVPSFPAATPDYTVSAWVRYAQADIGSNLATIVTTEIPTTGGWELQGPVNAEAAQLQFSYSRADGGYDTLICCQIQPDQWMHVTAVVDSQALTMTLYQGGVIQTQLNIRGSILPGNDTLHIGIEQTSTGFEWPFRGAVDEIRIYDHALNAAEVSRLDAGP
jgi:Concanavalin A-like lectin/glucanases superfamily